MKIGEKILLFRARQCLSQKQIADLIGVSVASISRAERDIPISKVKELKINDYIDKQENVENNKL